MRFTSLIIELIRARPRLVVWLVVLLQAALWLILPLLCIEAHPASLPRCSPMAGNTGSEPISARRWRSGSPISRSAPRAITCSASICWRSFARS
jgi:hypothetical protein